MLEDPKSEYEAPEVEQVETEDAPAVTAAGSNTTIDASDSRLKSAIRSLESSIIGRRDG